MQNEIQICPKFSFDNDEMKQTKITGVSTKNRNSGSQRFELSLRIDASKLDKN